MRIGVDARHLVAGRGVARYLRHALEALARRFPSDEWVAFVPGRGPVDVPFGVEVRRSPLPGRALFGAGALTGRPALERLCGGGLDVLWLPAPAPAGLDGSVPLVVTVHDLSWVVRPEDFTPYERAWHTAGRLDRQTRAAARVVCVSQATATLAQRAWGLDPRRVIVVPEGPGTPVVTSDPHTGPSTTTSSQPPPVVGSDPHGGPKATTAPGHSGEATPVVTSASPSDANPTTTSGRSGEATPVVTPASPSDANPTTAPYLLCVGALEPRKDPELLAGAHARARALGLDAELVFAGSGRLAARLEGRPGVRLAGTVDGAGLDALYRGALAVVAPAHDEGFGLTPLEALARGVAPVVADLPVYDETLGPGALRFPPGDARGLADALLELRDPTLRAQVISEGRAAIDRLSWDACADGLHAAFTEAVRSTPLHGAAAETAR
jgi:glycosyltransferase involved in cell wall biosynthesis